MKANLLAASFASLVLNGCAVWVVQPTHPLYTPVTSFQARFNPIYEPGTFKAFLDGNEITSLFTPAAGVPGGTATASWNLPFEGGYNPNIGVYVEANVFIDSVATSFFPAGSSLIHKLRVEGRCTPGIICIRDDEVAFTPIYYIASPIPLRVPLGTAISMELRADRNLAAPLFVTVQPMLLGSERSSRTRSSGPCSAGDAGKCANSRRRGDGPVSVAGLGRGGFLLRFSAPGTQVGGITGVVQ